MDLSRWLCVERKEGEKYKVISYISKELYKILNRLKTETKYWKIELGFLYDHKRGHLWSFTNVNKLM